METSMKLIDIDRERVGENCRV